MEEIEKILEKVKFFKSELDWVEVKSAKSGVPEKIYRTFSALSNREEGGYILFGLSDAPDFRIIGIPNLDRIQTVLSGIARDEMQPPIDIQMKSTQARGKAILLAYIPETIYFQKPCYYKPAGILNGSYIRIGNTNRHLSEYEVLLLMQNQKKAEDDRVVIKEAREFINSKEINTYIKMLKEENLQASFVKGGSEEIKERIGLIKESYPTMATILCLHPYPQKFFPSLSIQFLEPGVVGENVRYLDNKKFEGNIVELINNTTKYILSKLSKRTIVIGSERRDRYEISEVVIREVIRNALVHRDYSERSIGTPIQIFMYNDRFEFVNPGGLYGPVTIRNIVNSISTRNALVVRILEDLKIVENRGGGIDEILSVCDNYDLSEPKFINEISSFRAIIFRKERISNQEKSINSFLSSHRIFSTKDVMTYFEISRTNTIEHYISKMLKDKLVRREGSGRGSKYYKL